MLPVIPNNIFFPFNMTQGQSGLASLKLREGEQADEISREQLVFVPAEIDFIFQEFLGSEEGWIGHSFISP